jgi:response regulator RpfG family c-di-GMP phosphodiesterase
MDAIVATLLLFEQDRATRQLYGRELGRHWHVITVESAADCANVLTQEVVHAVVFELGAASDEDWALLTKIIQLATTARTPVIVCSAIDARSRGYALGVSAYLIKPVLPQQLIGEVARWLNDQAQREEPTRGDYVGTNTSS